MKINKFQWLLFDKGEGQIDSSTDSSSTDISSKAEKHLWKAIRRKNRNNLSSSQPYFMNELLFHDTDLFFQMNRYNRSEISDLNKMNLLNNLTTIMINEFDINENYLVDYSKWYNILCLYEINTYSNTFISYNVINGLTFV